MALTINNFFIKKLCVLLQSYRGSFGVGFDGTIHAFSLMGI
jgi:hypothetical protein